LSNKNKSFRHGLVIVYTGGGKGKTTAALGLAIRALGYDWRVCLIQFIKGTRKYGEIESVKRLAPNFELNISGEGFVGILDDTKSISEHKSAAKKALDLSHKKIISGDYDVVILDEINYALSLNLIEIEDILELIRIRPREVFLVLTGDKANKQVIEIADLVTEMNAIKHPYQKGLPPIKGIDF
jgi:cob(I)alamin adenosyltransferase